MKLTDLVTFHIAIFMNKFHKKLLPAVFDDFFRPANTVHDYSTRFSSNQTFAIPKARTNYQGAKVWNSIAEDVKSLSFKELKRKIKEKIIEKY